VKIKLLVVDDEEDIRQMLARHFKFRGFEVATAEHGRAAIEALEEARFDIVVSDIMMPVMDGIELLQCIHEDHPMVHAIMITGYVSLENAMACMRYGAQTCIFKPLQDLQELDAAVAEAVAAINHWVAILDELRAMGPADGAGAA